MCPAMLKCVFAYAHGGIGNIHSVLEKEKATEEAEEISREQRHAAVTTGMQLYSVYIHIAKPHRSKAEESQRHN
ncbi:uncharacterized [Tachysurus ichikawai]